MLLLGRRDVEDLLDVDALIDALAGAMADLSAGRASVPHRVGAVVQEREGLLAAMPGYTPSAGALAAKLVALCSGSPMPLTAEGRASRAPSRRCRDRPG